MYKRQFLQNVALTLILFMFVNTHGFSSGEQDLRAAAYARMLGSPPPERKIVRRNTAPEIEYTAKKSQNNEVDDTPQQKKTLPNPSSQLPNADRIHQFQSRSSTEPELVYTPKKTSSRFAQKANPPLTDRLRKPPESSQRPTKTILINDSDAQENSVNMQTPSSPPSPKKLRAIKRLKQNQRDLSRLKTKYPQQVVVQ